MEKSIKKEERTFRYFLHNGMHAGMIDGMNDGMSDGMNDGRKE